MAVAPLAPVAAALVLFASVTPSPLAAAAPVPDEALSLQDTLRRVVAGNVDLARERIVIETNAANFLALRGAFDFVLGGDVTFSRRTTPRLSATDFAGGETNTLRVNLQASRALETGGSVALGLTTDAINTNSVFTCGNFGATTSECTYYSSNLNLTFTHPLLRGFGTEIAQANLRRQRVAGDLGLLNRQARAANIMRDVVNGYWDLAYATQELTIRRSAVDLAREQLRATQAQIEVGRLAPVDAAAVERAIADREQEVVLSEQAVFLRTMDLRRQFGMPSDPRLGNFTATDVPTAQPRDVDVMAEIQHALEASPQLRSLKMGLKLNQIDLQTAAINLRPRLDFVGQFGSTGRNADLLDTVATTAGLDDLVWSAGFNFQVPLENRAAIGQYRATELGARRSRLDAGDLELAIRDSVMRLAVAIRTASRRVELARSTVTYAERNLEAEKARFAVGRSTNNDVLLRQQELKSAQIQVVRATIDLLSSETALSAVSGDLLERFGIRLAGS